MKQRLDKVEKRLEQFTCIICNKFRQGLSSRLREHRMNLTEDDCRRIALRTVNYGMDTQLVADQFGVSRRRVQQIAKEYRETGIIPKPGKPGPKPGSYDKLRKQVIAAKEGLVGVQR